jgi:hypothetical protein
MTATGTMIGTGIAPTLITVTCLFLSTASGGDFTRGIPYYGYGFYPSDDYNYPYGYDDYPYDSYHHNTLDPYSYYSDYAASAQSDNAVVSSVQSQLAKRGYYGGAVDGVTGDETQAAIARYQEDKDLSVTGTVTAATLQSLGLVRPTS